MSSLNGPRADILIFEDAEATMTRKQRKRFHAWARTPLKCAVWLPHRTRRGHFARDFDRWMAYRRRCPQVGEGTSGFSRFLARCRSIPHFGPAHLIPATPEKRQ